MERTAFNPTDPTATDSAPADASTSNGPVRPPGVSPVSVGVWESVRRRWPVIVLITLLFAGAGLAIGLARTPTFTAEARLSVGRVDLSTPGAFSTFATATQTLASQYSRAVDARPVTDRVGRQVGLSPAEVANRVSATPIPDSPVFRVDATGTSEQQATRIAGFTSEALARYTTALNRSSPDSDRLLKQFKKASFDLNRLTATRNRLTRAVANSPSQSNQNALINAETAEQTARLQYETVRTAYSNSRSNQAVTELVQVVTRPTKASSDMGSKLQLLVFIGLAGGLAAGLALATFLTNREARRAAFA